ncbi:MAG: HAMP domain-containing protein [Actinobacteria bacterium]|nr:HAMP domain-containing protein [Actinomycetota bacterium]
MISRASISASLRNWRGLRGRMILYFSLASFAAALALSIVTYASTRTYLLRQRTEFATRQAFNNAQLVRTVISLNSSDAGDLMSNIRSERGGYAVLHLGESDSFYPQEPLRFTQSNMPTQFVAKTLSGVTGRQRFLFNGEPYEAVGVNIKAIDAQYFEAFPLNDVARTLATIRNTLTLGVLLITLTAGLLGLSISNRVLRPLRRVTSVATDIASGGLDIRLADETDPELARLATSFNNMVDAVQSRIQRETRFASDVSHELRSPVTALAAAIEVLQARRDELSERNRQAFDIIATQVHRFDRTVLDLLELSRLDAGAGATSEETIHLAKFVQQVAARHGFSEVNFTTTLDLSDETVLDRRRIERIVLNLLENARDHAGGATAILVTGDQSEFLISIEDQGVGVAQSERDRIFERFARGTSSRNSTGSGLGLAIVQEHARALHGKAWVETSSSGGARFMVSIARKLPTEANEAKLL